MVVSQWKEHYLRYTQLKKLIGKLFPKGEKRRLESKRGSYGGVDDGEEGDEETKEPEEAHYVLNYQSDDVTDRYTGTRILQSTCARLFIAFAAKTMARRWSRCAALRSAKRR